MILACHSAPASPAVLVPRPGARASSGSRSRFLESPLLFSASTLPSVHLPLIACPGASSPPLSLPSYNGSGHPVEASFLPFSEPRGAPWSGEFCRSPRILRGVFASASRNPGGAEIRRPTPALSASPTHKSVLSPGKQPFSNLKAPFLSRSVCPRVVPPLAPPFGVGLVWRGRPCLQTLDSPKNDPWGSQEIIVESVRTPASGF